MKIWKKISLGFISVILIMIFVDYQALKNNIELIRQFENLEKSKRVELSESHKIAYSIQRIKSNIREILHEEEKKSESYEISLASNIIKTNLPILNQSLNKINDATQIDFNFAEAANDLDELKLEAEEIKLLDSLSFMVNHFITDVNQFLNLHESEKFKEADAFFETVPEPMSRAIQNLIAKIAHSAEIDVSEAIEEMNEQVSNAIKLGISLTILCIFLALGIGFYIAKTISKPLNKLIDGTNEIGKGNFETIVTIETKDELELLGNSFNGMAKELKLKVNAINNLNSDLVESNNAKDTFLSIIAHDLKNPFNIILGFSNLLSENYENYDDKKRIQYINYIDQSAKQTFELLENLLTWSRAQSGKIEINKEVINLNTTINKSLNLYSHNAKNKNITVVNNVTNETFVFADKFTLAVIINNIINNAIKFTPNSGKITVSANIITPTEVEVSIKDTGVGMSPEILENLLQTKTSISNKGTNNEVGSGLGLTLIKTFVNKNGGKLWVKSEIGKGSEFKFSLSQ